MGDKLRSQSVVGSVLFTHEGKNPLEYVLYPAAQGELSQGFSQGHFHHQFSKTFTQLIVLFRVFRFSAASFNAVTSFIRNIFKPGRHLVTEMYQTLP